VVLLFGISLQAESSAMGSRKTRVKRVLILLGGGEEKIFMWEEF